jgi:NitT/TauT family transport system permease protein
MIIEAEGTFQISKMYAGIVTVALLGIIVNMIMIQFEKRVTRWKEDINL